MRHTGKDENVSQWKTGLTLSLATAMLWGFLPIIMKGAIKEFDPLTATWFRFVGGAAVIGLWLLFCKRSSLVPAFTGKVRWLLPLAVLCMSGNFSLLSCSLLYQSPSITQTVLQIGPPLVFLGGAVLFKERIGLLQWFGFFALFPGLALFFNVRLQEVILGQSQLTIGVLLITLSAICFATYSLCQKAMMPQLRPETTLFWGLAGGVVLLLPFATPSQLLQASPVGIVLLLAAILNTFLPFLCYGQALRVWDTSRVGAIVAMPPVVTVFATGIVAGIIPDYIQLEGLNFYSFLGVFIVVSGCMMGALGRGRVPVCVVADLTRSPA